MFLGFQNPNSCRARIQNAVSVAIAVSVAVWKQSLWCSNLIPCRGKTTVWPSGKPFQYGHFVAEWPHFESMILTSICQNVQNILSWFPFFCGRGVDSIQFWSILVKHRGDLHFADCAGPNILYWKSNILGSLAALMQVWASTGWHMRAHYMCMS